MKGIISISRKKISALCLRFFSVCVRLDFKIGEEYFASLVYNVFTTGTLGCVLNSAEVPPVRNLSEYRDDENFVYPGLSHKTAAGVVHGMKQVSMLHFQRHACCLH